MLEFVTQSRERFRHACSIDKTSLSASQNKMKQIYDRKAVLHSFQPGEKVLVLVPTPGPALSVKFTGPYIVKSKLDDMNCIIHTPDRRRQTRLCHVSLL